MHCCAVPLILHPSHCSPCSSDVVSIRSGIRIERELNACVPLPCAALHPLRFLISSRFVHVQLIDIHYSIHSTTVLDHTITSFSSALFIPTPKEFGLHPLSTAHDVK